MPRTRCLWFGGLESKLESTSRTGSLAPVAPSPNQPKAAPIESVCARRTLQASKRDEDIEGECSDRE